MNVSRGKLAGVALVLFAATTWLYWPCVHGGFLAGMDDDEYLRQAARLRGFTWDAVTWAFTDTRPYYHPLTRLSHVLDYQMWGRNAAGHHATSVVLHALNAALVFGFLWSLLGKAPVTTAERVTVALGVSVVFAIHPLQAESVAWMAGRTQLLCTAFGIGCLWAYVAGLRRWIVWALFVLALLCKPMAVSFPFVMLALDYFPLRRYGHSGWRRLLWEKAVLVALAAAVGLGAMITESREGGPGSAAAAVPLLARLLRASESLTFYLRKLCWPARLSAFYPPQTGLSLSHWPVFVSVLSVAIITALVVLERRRMPAVAAAWASYVVLVLPVAGLAQLGWSTVAPRYAYVALLPLLLMVGMAAVWLWRHSKGVAHVGLIGLLTCELCVFAIGTRSLIPAWHDTETFWRIARARFPDSIIANRSLVHLFLDQGRSSEALESAQQWVETAPELDDAHFDLGSVLDRLGRPEEAVVQYEQALRINPNYAEAHVNLGNAFLRMGRIPGAVGEYETALRINPGLAEAHSNLGAIDQRTGKLPEAIAEYEKSLQIKPDYAEAHFNLGLALEKVGRTPEAIEHYQQAVKLRPDFTPATKALARLGAVQ